MAYLGSCCLPGMGCQKLLLRKQLTFSHNSQQSIAFELMLSCVTCVTIGWPYDRRSARLPLVGGASVAAANPRTSYCRRFFRNGLTGCRCYLSSAPFCWVVF